MGRAKHALAEQKEIRALAEWLTALRERSGLSYSQVAVRNFYRYSISTFYRADKGITVPAWPVVEAYTKACGGSVREAKQLWRKASSSSCREAGGRPPVGGGRALRYITEVSQLRDAMVELRLRVGKPTLRELEARALRNGVSYLPKSTLQAVLAGKRDCSQQVLVEFVRACGVSPQEEAEWVEALRRIHSNRRASGAPLPEAERRLAEAEAEILRLREAICRGMTESLLREAATAVDTPVPVRRWRSRPPTIPPQSRPSQRPVERTT
ncbi:helix-turn-helix domain-containing protein [Kitasatospora aureofaciens]|uniref:helix-turn-helix domain-containing protein n=1 Tax=Kitasatospora aureofaciens TaxID=1894 RepID=UPI0037CA2592